MLSTNQLESLVAGTNTKEEMDHIMMQLQAMANAKFRSSPPQKSVLAGGVKADGVGDSDDTVETEKNTDEEAVFQGQEKDTAITTNNNADGVGDKRKRSDSDDTVETEKNMDEEHDKEKDTASTTTNNNNADTLRPASLTRQTSTFTRHPLQRMKSVRTA